MTREHIRPLDPLELLVRKLRLLVTEEIYEAVLAEVCEEMAADLLNRAGVAPEDRVPLTEKEEVAALTDGPPCRARPLGAAPDKAGEVITCSRLRLCLPKA